MVSFFDVLLLYIRMNHLLVMIQMDTKGGRLEVVGRVLRSVGVRLVPHIFAAFCNVDEGVVVVGVARGCT